MYWKRINPKAASRFYSKPILKLPEFLRCCKKCQQWKQYNLNGRIAEV
jgi:hypothetical protein